MVILTGASGAGKTTLAHRFRDHVPSSQVFCFDSVGVPSPEAMQREYGSGEQWQKAMTLGWMERIKPLLTKSRSVLFEGQMRISFIEEALVASNISRSDAKIILVDCDDAIRRARLSVDRSQPELAGADMMNWARYLREEAAAAKVEILDTGVTPFSACIAYLEGRFT